MLTNDPFRPSAPTAAKYTPGQIVRHTRHEYRGVIVDVDPSFQGADELYEEAVEAAEEEAQAPKDHPWYHVLVDEEDVVTYVAEGHLAVDRDDSPIDHPMLEDFLGERRDDGSYAPLHTVN